MKLRFDWGSLIDVEGRRVPYQMSFGDDESLLTEELTQQTAQQGWIFVMSTVEGCLVLTSQIWHCYRRLPSFGPEADQLEAVGVLVVVAESSATVDSRGLPVLPPIPGATRPS